MENRLLDFLKRANTVHNNVFDYTKFCYINNKTKGCIICPEHGEFWQTPQAHLRGNSCPKCSLIRRASKQTDNNKTFVEKATKTHFHKYDYSKVEYVNSQTKVCIICPEHGEFWQTPQAHLRGQGCPECGKITRSFKKSDSNETFIKKATDKHNGKYDYSKVEYVNSQTKVCIICSEHGEFWQTPANHISGCGCPKCGAIESGINQKNYNFFEHANIIHNGKYSYSDDYKNARTKIKILCPIHGEFGQTPHDHLQGHGCPKCGHINSKVEDEIANAISPLECEHNNRTILNGKEIDIYIPSLKLGIEYNGLRWHSEDFGKDRHYHLDKLNGCNDKGVNLIQIFEDEWVHHKDIVISKIKHISHIDNDKHKIFARKCIIKEVSKEEAKVFLNKHHIQGYVGATVYLGLYYQDKLVALMDFKKEKDGYWDLNRFATDIEYNCIGAGGKLFKHFINHYDYKEIKSFADRRWTINPTDNLYTKLGFKLDGFTIPDYRYFIEGDIERHHKFGFRKQILHKKYGLPLTMTEKEMVTELGYHRIWDCGLIKYVYKNDESKID